MQDILRLNTKTEKSLLKEEIKIEEKHKEEVIEKIDELKEIKDRLKLKGIKSDTAKMQIDTSGNQKVKTQKTFLMNMMEKKLGSEFLSGVEEGLKELKQEVKALQRVEKNYSISLQTGIISQKPMFPEWNFKDHAQRAKFDKLVHILEKHEARDPKLDLAFLKTEMLQNWTALVESFGQINQYVNEPLNDLDLTELSKVVNYRVVNRGQQIEPTNEEKKPEIYIILKGNVRLAYPMEDSDNERFQSSPTKVKSDKMGFWPTSPASFISSPGMKSVKNSLSRKITQGMNRSIQTPRSNFDDLSSGAKSAQFHKDVDSMNTLIDQLVNHHGANEITVGNMIDQHLDIKPYKPSGRFRNFQPDHQEETGRDPLLSIAITRTKEDPNEKGKITIEEIFVAEDDMGKPMEKLKVIDPNAPDDNRKHGSFKNAIRLTALEQNLQSIHKLYWTSTDQKQQNKQMVSFRSLAVQSLRSSAQTKFYLGPNIVLQRPSRATTPPLRIGRLLNCISDPTKSGPDVFKNA